MAACRDLFSMECLSELKLLGGKEGLNRSMRWVYNILSQPFGDWVNYGDLIFYNAAGRDTSESQLLLVVEEAKRCELAGVVFLLDEELLPCIPQSVGTLADELHLPAFTLPISSAINNIQREIILHILSTEKELKKETIFWTELLFADHANIDDLISQAYQHDINPKLNYSLYLIQFCNLKKYCDLPVQRRQVQKPSEILSGFYNRVHFLLQEFTEYWVIDHQGSCIVILPFISSSFGAERDQSFIQIAESLNNQYPGARIRISKGSCIEKLSFARKSYQEAQRAIYIENLYPEVVPFIDYAKLGFQRLLYEINDLSLLREYVYDTIGPILEYDKKNHTNYYDTLICYYRNFKNVVKTAKTLNYHRNSVIMRLHKMEEILHLDLDSIADFYNIYVALEIEEYLRKIDKLNT